MAAADVNPVNPDDTASKVEFKKTSFDREFRALITQSQEIIKAKYGVSLDIGDVRPEFVCLNRYLSIYNSMTPDEHFRYFETLYGRKRHEILNCLKDDRWLRTGGITIQFGEGIKSTKEIEEKRKQVRIMVSDIYLIACELQAQAEKSLDGIDITFAKDVGGKDLIRPSIVLLHLIRIFYILNEGTDKVQLGAILTQLETDLGVSKKTVYDEAPPKVPLPETGPAVTGGLSSLFSLATGMMEKMGYKPPPGMKPPSEGEITTVINTVFNNETTQNAIQGMFTSLQGCNDFGTAVQEVVKNVTDPKTMEAIQGSVMQTAQAASFGQGVPTEPGGPVPVQAQTPGSSSSTQASGRGPTSEPGPSSI